MGSPTGRQTRWGKGGAPQRGGLPGVERRVSTSQAEAAPAVTVGQHESSGGRARRNGGSARLGRRPRPPQRWVSTSQAEAAPAVTVGQHEGNGGRCYGRKNAPLDESSGAWGSLREGIQPVEDLFEEQQGGNKAGDLRDGEGEPDVLQHAGERKEIRHRDEDDELTPE